MNVSSSTPHPSVRKAHQDKRAFPHLFVAKTRNGLIESYSAAAILPKSPLPPSAGHPCPDAGRGDAYAGPRANRFFSGRQWSAHITFDPLDDPHRTVRKQIFDNDQDAPFSLLWSNPRHGDVH